ncbi:MAG: hypothetical protein DRP54_01350 [Spirochaetes bacterium]|nr:MAG: hypothetical protein DRP54_01350 [Spirochaetota bacterium]
MKNEIVLVSFKAEHGLLSISDEKTKALMPIFGGLKLADIYLKPITDFFGKNISFLANSDAEILKEYIIYKYSSFRINVYSYNSPEELVSLLLKLGKNRRVCLIFSDYYVEPLWINDMLAVIESNENCIIETFDGKIFGIVLVNTSLLSGMLDFIGSILKRKPVDNYISSGPLSSFNKIKLGVEGKRLASVFDYYMFHMDMLKRCERLYRFISYYGIDVEGQTLIGDSGFVRRSFLLPSSTIDGIVENSIIGRNTKVGSKSIIKNSIIMENNYIGSGCVIQNSIICENREPISRITPNFADGVVIGGVAGKGSNGDFPDYIKGGITLIGRDVEIPKGVRLAENCYIPSGMGRNHFRNKKLFEAGESLLI